MVLPVSFNHLQQLAEASRCISLLFFKYFDCIDSLVVRHSIFPCFLQQNWINSFQHGQATPDSYQNMRLRPAPLSICAGLALFIPLCSNPASSNFSRRNSKSLIYAIKYAYNILLRFTEAFLRVECESGYGISRHNNHVESTVLRAIYLRHIW